MVNDKYYKGYEGEPEIQFICEKGYDKSVFIIWEGYFDRIMKQMLPDNHGWSGLAYHYNMYTGWYENSPWVIDDLEKALGQFEAIDKAKLDDDTLEVLSILCDMIREAILNNYRISIARE